MRVYNELFLLRELVKECFEDVKLTLLQNGNDGPNENEPIFLSSFNFPLQHVNELNTVEQYLQEPNHFQSTVRPLYFLKCKCSSSSL